MKIQFLYGTECFSLVMYVLICFLFTVTHYRDVIMSAIAFQITGVSIVCSTVCSRADQRKHQSSASLAFVREIQRWPVDSPRKGTVMKKMFHLMTSAWRWNTCVKTYVSIGFIKSWKELIQKNSFYFDPPIIYQCIDQYIHHFLCFKCISSQFHESLEKSDFCLQKKSDSFIVYSGHTLILQLVLHSNHVGQNDTAPEIDLFISVVRHIFPISVQRTAVRREIKPGTFFSSTRRMQYEKGLTFVVILGLIGMYCFIASLLDVDK